MAGKGGTQAATASDTSNNTTPARPDLSGFDDVGRPDIDGWVKASEGLEVYGKICGFFAFQQAVKDKDAPGGFRVQTREALCVKLGMPVRLFKKGDESGFIAEKGQVAAISMMYSLDDVRPYIDKRGLVYFKFTKKVPTGNGQTVWKADVKAKGEKTAPAKAVIVAATETTPASTSSGDDEIPF